MTGECDDDNDCKCRDKLSLSSIIDHNIDKWSAQYPDLRTVSDIVTSLSQEHNNTCGQHQDQYDGKWRPYSLLLGVLYRVQQWRLSQEFSVDGRYVETDGDDLVDMFGYFWHMIRAADETLRRDLNDKQEHEVTEQLQMNKIDYARLINVERDDVVMVWSGELSGAGHVSHYTPDHVVTLDRKRKLIILTILGTQVFPRPQPLDIIMDLLADTRPFLQGEAHSGIALGAINIIKKTGPVLRDQALQHPEYEVLILGYSLGAGLAQLITLDCEMGDCRHMLPENTVIRTIGYGSPPVFTMNHVQDIPSLDNIVLVQNSQDGIFGASIKNIHDVIDQICALKNMNIKRRSLLKLFFSGLDEDPYDDDYEIETIEFDDGSEDDEEEDELIDVIQESLSQATSSSSEPELFHLASTILTLERSYDDNDEVTIDVLKGQDNIEDISLDLRLDKSMLGDHLPEGGYDDLFNNIGVGEDQRIDVSILDKFRNQGQDDLTTTKKPFRKRIKEKWNDVKDFFKNIG